MGWWANVTEAAIEDEPEPVRRGLAALGRTVGDFADPAEQWELVVQCQGACRTQRRLVADLVPLVPAGLSWAEVVPKLRCSHCGEPADIVGLSGPPETPGFGGVWLLLQHGSAAWRR
jgi:hypothetical protein